MRDPLFDIPLWHHAIVASSPVLICLCLLSLRAALRAELGEEDFQEVTTIVAQSVHPVIVWTIAMLYAFAVICATVALLETKYQQDMLAGEEDDADLESQDHRKLDDPSAKDGHTNSRRALATPTHVKCDCGRTIVLDSATDYPLS